MLFNILLDCTTKIIQQIVLNYIIKIKFNYETVKPRDHSINTANNLIIRCHVFQITMSTPLMRLSICLPPAKGPLCIFYMPLTKHRHNWLRRITLCYHRIRSTFI